MLALISLILQVSLPNKIEEGFLIYPTEENEFLNKEIPNKINLFMKKTIDENYSIEDAKIMYQNAIEEANKNNLEKASEIFDLILSNYPYSIWATKSKVMSAWVYYEGNNYDSSIATAQNFIKNNPENELVPYALYLIAMSYYERIIDVERDANMTVKAIETFENLIYQFPNSEYARDAKLKIELARSNLAGKQMSIGRFYQKQEQENQKALCN